MKTIKILLVDDSSIYRMSIKQNLNRLNDIEVVGECIDGSLVLDFLKQQFVNVILMDISMKKMNGIETTKLVKCSYPEVKVIALSSHGDSYYIDQMIDAGASSFLSKWEASIKLIQETIVSVFEEA